MLPSTIGRVSLHTSDRLNRAIQVRTDEMVKYYAEHPERIDERLAELDAEWDIERTLEANAASLALAGLALGTFVNRKFYVLPAVVTGFLLQHALQGWCPPVPLFRRLGVRTQAEIDEERYALKALRGDFDDYYTGSIAEPAEHARAALAAARA